MVQKLPSQNFPDLVFFETGAIFLLRVTRKFGSPSLSRLGVWRDLEIENKAKNTGLGLGLVAEMKLVETRTGDEYMQSGGTQTDVKSVMKVDLNYCDGGEYVVYGSGDDDGGIWQR